MHVSPSEVQDSPVAGVPFAQVHVGGNEQAPSASSWKPSSQAVQFCSPCIVQPLGAGMPFVQLQLFTQLLPSRWNPVLQPLQMFALSPVQALPVAAFPFEQVHVGCHEQPPPLFNQLS
jgi:hypothetical protein